MSVDISHSGFSLSLARSQADLHAAQRLRYEVFVEELGGAGAGVDHDNRRESDNFDTLADHLLLRADGSDDVIGVYRVMRAEHAHAAGGFYSETEFDLDPLRGSGRNLMELGRSCIHPDFRGSAAMMYLWYGLARYASDHGCDFVFGVASLKGTDVPALAPQLSLLRYNYLAPTELRPKARIYQDMSLVPESELNRKAAMVALPPLVKSYLRLGGRIGDGAYVDHAFNCTDVCVVLEAQNLRNAPWTARLIQAAE